MSDDKKYELGAFYMYDIKPQPQSRFAIVNYVKRKLKIGVPNKEDNRKSIVQKSGHYKIKYTGLKEQRARYLRDLYVTLIDLQWRYVLAILFNACLISYLFFAIMWYWLMSNHGDFNHLNDKDFGPCVVGVESFAGAILFSIETQTSIGYGWSYINSKCSGALILLFVQVIVGILMENLLLGFIFAKFAQPKRRQKTLLFSKAAVVNQEDGELGLQIRIGDMRQSHLLDARVHGVLIKKHVTSEGVVYPLYLNEMEFKAHGMDEKIVLMWPLILTHKINKDSPFWNIKPSDLMSEKYELVVYIEGTIESTGEFCQSRTSYLPQEIMWGHRFDRIEEFDAGNGRWEIDFDGFHDIVYTTNIRHSAQELYDLRTKIPTQKDENSTGAVRKRQTPPPASPILQTIVYDLPLDMADIEKKKIESDDEENYRETKDEESVPLTKSFFDPKDADESDVRMHDILSRKSPEMQQPSNDIETVQDPQEFDLGDGRTDGFRMTHGDGHGDPAVIRTDDDDEYVSA